MLRFFLIGIPAACHVFLCGSLPLRAQHESADTFAALTDGQAPSNYSEMWGDFDPWKEPLESETLAEWEEDGVILRVVRFRIGIFKGQPARLAAVYGYPKGQQKLPGLLQIHGGGQYGDANACLANAKRGYATISIAWAGRISSSKYRVNPEGVQLFWNAKTDDPDYRLTTDWGLVDGYHAPSRNQGNQFPSAKPAEWTLDGVESPRNSGWFLCAVAARRAITFLEQQPEVDASRLGVYGHSMGGKLTVLTAPDSRVKAAAPSCGGISDRYNDSSLFCDTLGDDVSLAQITCPIFFLSPSNDFHGRIGDLPKAIDEIKSKEWRVTCSPHHNHQDTPPYEVATLLWFDEHLKGTFTTPDTPKTTLSLKGSNGIPTLAVSVDDSMPIHSIDVYYTQHGKPNETPFDRIATKHRFWRHADVKRSGDQWVANLSVTTIEKPLWVFANVTYKLNAPISGAGYYYGPYTATTFNLSSLLQTATPEQLRDSNLTPKPLSSKMIESFQGDWEKEWFTYKLADWSRKTHKLNDDQYKAPENATLQIDVQAETANTLIILLDEFAAEVSLTGGNEYQRVALSVDDFKNFEEESLTDWHTAKLLTLAAAERLRPTRGPRSKSRIVGRNREEHAERLSVSDL